MSRINSLRGLFGHPKGESSKTQELLAELRQAGSARAQIIVKAVEALPEIFKWILGIAAFILAAWLLKSGHFVFVTTAAVVVLTLVGQYRIAGIVLIVIGIAGIGAYLSELGTLGTSLDEDAYPGDETSASPTLQGLLSIVLLTCGAFLVKNGRYLISELALVGFILLLEYLVLGLKGLEDWSKIALIAYYIALLALAVAILFLLLGKWKNVIVGTIMIAAVNATWLLLPHGGGPEAAPGSNFDTWKGGFFEQCFYGGLLVGLGLFFLIWLPGLLAAEPEPKEPTKADDGEELPETADLAARNAWRELSPEGREIFEEIYPELLSDEFSLDSELLDIGLERLNLTEKDLEKSDLPASRIIVLAGDRFERGAIEADVVRKNGSLRRGWQQAMGIKNNDLLEEIAVDQDSLREAVERRQAVEEKSKKP